MTRSTTEGVLVQAWLLAARRDRNLLAQYGPEGMWWTAEEMRDLRRPTLGLGKQKSLLERCPVTDSRHRINHASSVSAHSTPLARFLLSLTSINDCRERFRFTLFATTT